MPLLAIVLTASQIVSAAGSVPNFDLERTCRPVATMRGLPGRLAACQRDEQDARSKLERDWSQYSGQNRSRCAGFVGVGGPPSYVELLTCLEVAKQAKELRENPKSETVGRRSLKTLSANMGHSKIENHAKDSHAEGDRHDRQEYLHSCSAARQVAGPSSESL
jgi:hypothetical protein